jgi:TolB-like protein
MPEARRSPKVVRFGTFEVDLRAGELRKHGLRIRLQEQPFQVLAALLERPSEIVTREELRKKLWPADTFVDFDHGLNKAINKIREALSDSAENPRFVETVARRGYRFLVPVEWLGEKPSLAAPTTDRGIAPDALSRSPHALSPAAGKIRLVVLPFQNLSGDPEQEFFSDGLTEEMISQLARVSPQRLGVIARTSAMRLKGAKGDVVQIGKQLQLDYILEGSVRRVGSRVRITAQLIQVHDQTHMWVASYDRELADVFAIQREVAESVARSLALELLPGTSKALARRTPINPAAYEDYLKGRYYWNRFTGEETRKAIAHFERAIEREPDYGPAYDALSLCFVQLCFLNVLPPKEGYPVAKAAALKALSIDDTLAEARGAVALCNLYNDWDWTAAEEQFKRALLLDHGGALIHHEYALYLAAMGRLKEAQEEDKQALSLDPLSLLYHTALARLFYFAHDDDRALEECRKALELDTSFHMAHGQLGLVYARKRMFGEAVSAFQEAIALSRGNPAYLAAMGHAYGQAGMRREAVEALEKLHEISTQRFVSSYFMGLVYLGLEERGEAFRFLEAACAERYLWLVYLNVDPAFDALRSDRRFQDLVRRVGLPP